MSPSLSQALMLRKSDQALCAAVRDGHEAAFAAIVLRYRSQLLRHCRSLLRDGHAEDAVQQTFVRALQALRSGTDVRELGPWLHRIARNVALTELSASGRGHAELSEEWADHRRDGEFDRRADLREALLAVQALPDRQRTALLRSVAGDKPAVIAEQLGLSQVAVRQLLHRARVSVRAAVNAFLPPPLVWLSRRLAAACDKVPRAAGVPAAAAPVASKVAVVVVASATVAAPAAVIHSVLSHHHRHHRNRTPRVTASRPAPAAPVVEPRVVITAHLPTPPPARSRPVARRTHRSAPARRPPQPAPPPRSVPAPPTSTASSQETGISASSPNSPPIGTGSSSDNATSGAPIAGAASASGATGSTSSGAGPVSTASASGPTTASGS